MPPPRRPDAGPTAPSFREQVFHLVRQIPCGRVSSYGDIAAMLGRPRSARGVGWALASLSDDGTPEGRGGVASLVPWWRVVNHRGEVSSPSLHHVAQRQRALLEAEGIRPDESGRIDRERYGWWPSAPPEPDGTA